MLAKLHELGCEVRGDAEVRKRDPQAVAASEKDWRTEYLDAIVSIRLVDGVEEAIAHIAAHASHHTDAIITEEIALDNPHSTFRTPQSLRLRFLARDFFQNNPFILPAFTDYVRGQAAAGGARFLVDAYCGSGLFALSAARAFERVAGVGIEEEKEIRPGEDDDDDEDALSYFKKLASDQD